MKTDEFTPGYINCKMKSYECQSNIAEDDGIY